MSAGSFPFWKGLICVTILSAHIGLYTEIVVSPVVPKEME